MPGIANLRHRDYLSSEYVCATESLIKPMHME